MRIAIIGRGEFLYRSAELLAEAGHKIAFIITAKEAPEYLKTSSDFEKLANDTGAGFLHTAKINSEEALSWMKSFGVTDIGISVNYPGIIFQEAIDVFPLGILNAHSGDLPRYRGNAPLAWAIINGEKKVALCIHRMVGGELDAGNIIVKEYHPVSENTRIGELYSWFSETTPELFLKAVNLLAGNRNLEGEKQSGDPSHSLRCYPRNAEDGRINWQQPAKDIIRLINASSEPFAGAYAFFRESKIIIWRAALSPRNENYCAVAGQVIPDKEGYVDIVCGEGCIRVTEVTYEGSRTSKPAGILSSVRSRLK